jgi:hypothetical protein
MNRPWKQFLFSRFPRAALVLALTAQALAFSLSNVPMWRDRTDELALAVLRDSANYRILLFGDSITRNATARFSLGASGEIANLATNAYIGLSGSLFLLERYLSIHPAPQHVVIALAPGMYHYENDTSLARYHLWHTFNRPDERSFLSTYFPGIRRHDWFPAILDLQESIAEPLFSFLKQQYLAFRNRDALSVSIGSLNPSAEAPVDLAIHIDSNNGDGIGSDDRDLAMALVNAESLSRVCQLSKTHGFLVNIVWPPMPPRLGHVLNSSGALSELEAKIRSIMEGPCHFDGFTDFNKIRTYQNSSFHHDMMHLFGDGWEQRYASDLKEYLNALPYRNPMEATR